MRSLVRYVHTNLVARDWRRLARFYCEALGCTLEPPERDLEGAWLDRLTAVRNAHLRGARLRLPGYARGGPTLEIFQYCRAARARPSPVHAPGLRHLAFAVTDVEQALAQVRRYGGSSVGAVVSAAVEGVGELDIVSARDPEGNIIELQRWERSRKRVEARPSA